MPKPVPDLRTSVVPLEVHRITNIQSLRENAEKQWNLRRFQTLFPSIETLFKLDSVRTPYHFGLKLRNPIQTIASPSSVYVGGSEIPVHKKTTMILPSYRVMRGDFGTSGLPCDKENSEEEHEKLHSPHNAAYVGALANVILSESGCQHFPEVYGTYTAIASRHVLDISDDYEDLSDRPWFLQNLGHFFELKLKRFDTSRESIELGELVELDAEVLEPIETTAVPSHFEEVEIDSDEEDGDEEDDDSGSVSTGYIFAVHTCSSDGSGHEDGQAFEEEEETFAEAIFHDTPVQVTVMQQCTDTFYHLLKENPEPVKRVAWITQVMFALAYAQRNYGFVHNDLHVNNIMYVPTTKEYFYYNLGGHVYRVPTYGKLLKIIDFDRSTFSVKLAGMREAKFFMSDQYDIDEEAGGQYNVEPFYNNKFSEVKPNASFDLVRLATSMFWDCYPKGPFELGYQSDPVFLVLMRWMTLPDGSSIMFRNLTEKDTHARYRGFHLYKAIARYCKGTAVPKQQIEKWCGTFVTTEKLPAGESCLIFEDLKAF